MNDGFQELEDIAKELVERYWFENRYIVFACELQDYILAENVTLDRALVHARRMKRCIKARDSFYVWIKAQKEAEQWNRKLKDK